MTRSAVAVVPGFPASLAIARASDLAALVPEHLTAAARAGMCGLLAVGCATLLTEDMQDGLVVAGRLTLRNPFRPG